MEPEVLSRRALLPLFCALLFWCAASPALAAPSPSPHPSPARAAVTPAPTATATPTPVPPLPLSEIAPAAQTTLAKLKNVEPEAAPDQTAASIQDALPALDRTIDDLRDQTSKAAGSAGNSLDTLHNQQLAWGKLEETLKDQSTVLGKRGEALEKESEEVQEISQTWVATRDTPTAADVTVPPETHDLVSRVIDDARAAQSRLKARQNRVLELQNRVGALLGRIDAGQELVDQAMASAVKTLFVRESAPLWSPEAQFAPDLPGRWSAARHEQIAQAREFVDAHSTLFAVHAAVFLALLALLLSLRRIVHRWTEDEPHLKRAAPVFNVPVATALVLSFLLMGRQYAGAPRLVHAAVSALALLPTVVLLRRLLARRRHVVLWSLVVFTLLDQARAAVDVLPTVSRWLFCAEMLGATGVFLFLLRLRRGDDPAARTGAGRWVSAVYALAVGVFVVALGANVLGYARLGTFLGSAALQSAYTAVFLYALLRVIDGLTVIALRVRPVSASRIAQTHRDEVQAQVYTVFRIGAVLLWLQYTLAQLQQYDRLRDWIIDTLDAEHGLGTIHLSLGKLLGFAVAIWLSLLVSRVLRFFLSEEVYERVQLAPGLPYAISTMLNYLVLCVGSLVALGVLGVPLEKFAIVASAFSVGLGFGLQNVINNFVSGVILLFERPVKVGDVIQFGDATGEVRRIGIRASIIRTREGSDIILPNGNLISNQVTNWTYSDRRRAVEVALTVAAGPDPNRVIQILKTAATTEPATEDQPAPEVYITGIAVGGISLIVRAWTHRYEDWIEVRSELNVALLAALAREEIKLI